MIALNIDAWKILVILNVIFSFAVICYSLGEPAFDRGTSILKHRRLLATCSRPFFQAGRSGCSARWVGCQHLWGRSAGALSRRLPLLIRSLFEGLVKNATSEDFVVWVWGWRDSLHAIWVRPFCCNFLWRNAVLYGDCWCQSRSWSCNSDQQQCPQSDWRRS